MSYQIQVKDKNGQKSSINLGEGKNLSQVLNTVNSPILFGCRTGICGTCCVKVCEGQENVNTISEDEQEIVELYSDDLENTRLACQLEVKGNLKLEYVGK